MRWSIIIGFLAFASPAIAGPQCTTEPSSKWLDETDMKTKIVASGYKIDLFKKTTGGCYEIYGRNLEGKRVEIYFNPISGDAVKISTR